MLFNKSKYWKVALMIMGAAILMFTILYSNFLATNLRKNEEKNIFLYTEAIQRLFLEFDNNNEQQCQENFTLFLEMVRDSFPLPVVYEDASGGLEGFNFEDKTLNSNVEFLFNKRKSFLAEGKIPITTKSEYATKIYCFNSPLLRYIKLFPLVQGLLVGLYIALGYFLFSSSRRAEQNRVWAGMAKETAHQLGTPISAILGWIEILKESFDEKPENMEILKELTKDVDRLELVADRFSKIGSEPILHEANIFEELIEVKDYLQRRAPRKVVFDFVPPSEDIFAAINKHLFAWVVENLVRNSLDAMDGKGTISCRLYKQNYKVYIDISDTGYGIPNNKFKSVFKPGYSTKKRGWGLGLSLSKRIIEEYHKGKIYVKSSKPNEETTFGIILPIN